MTINQIRLLKGILGVGSIGGAYAGANEFDKRFTAKKIGFAPSALSGTGFAERRNIRRFSQSHKITDLMRWRKTSGIFRYGQPLYAMGTPRTGGKRRMERMSATI